MKYVEEPFSLHSFQDIAECYERTCSASTSAATETHLVGTQQDKNAKNNIDREYPSTNISLFCHFSHARREPAVIKINPEPGRAAPAPLLTASALKQEIVSSSSSTWMLSAPAWHLNYELAKLLLHVSISLQQRKLPMLSCSAFRFTLDVAEHNQSQISEPKRFCFLNHTNYGLSVTKKQGLCPGRPAALIGNN